MRAELDEPAGRRLQLQPAHQGPRRGVHLRHPRPDRREDLRRGPEPDARKARGGRSASSRHARGARRRDLPRRHAPSTSSPTSTATPPRATACRCTTSRTCSRARTAASWRPRLGGRAPGRRARQAARRATEGDPARWAGWRSRRRARRGCRCRRWPSVHVDQRPHADQPRAGRPVPGDQVQHRGARHGHFVDEAQTRVEARGEAARGLLPDLGRRVREPAAGHEAAGGDRARSRCW